MVNITTTTIFNTEQVMDEAVFNILRIAGLNMDSSKTKEDISTSEIISGIILCLKYLKAPGSDTIPNQIPDAIAEKYKFGMHLTSILKDIGYRGKVGYDTFLYGSEIDLKKILLYIQELFPSVPKNNSHIQEERVQLIKQVQTQMNVLEAPSTKSYWKTQASLLASASGSERHALWKVLQKISIQRGKKKGKPPLPPKPSATNGQKLDEKVESKSASEQKKLQLEKLKEAIGTVEQELDSLSTTIVKGSQKLQSEKLKLVKESSQSRASKIARDLFDDFEPSCERLNRKLVELEEKKTSMQEQWDAIKGTLVAEKVQLASAQDPIIKEVEKERETVNKLRSKVASTRSSFQTAETMLKSLEDQQNLIASSKEKIYKRSHYTKRILEFNRTVEQQKEEATKVLGDIRVVQRSLNNTAGKLSRGFAEAEELMFQTALQMVVAKPCYKYLTEIHFMISEIVSLVQNKGAVDREIDAIEGEVHFEKRKNLIEKFAKISKDIIALKMPTTH